MWVKRKEDPLEFWESESRGSCSEGAIAAHDWGCKADAVDVGLR